MNDDLDIKVTGAGVIAPCGVGMTEFWHGLTHGRTGRATIDDTDLRAGVRDMHLVDPSGCLQHSAARYGLAAAREALSQAGRNGSKSTRDNLGLVVGTGMGEAARLDAARSSGYTDNRAMFSSAHELAARLSICGPVVSVSNACAASLYAIGLACDMLAADEVPAVLVVGAEAYSRVALAAFNRMMALDPFGARPFERERNGTLFGEGAGAILLEPSSSPARGIARILRVAFSCDAGHLTAPDQTGEQIRRTLTDALGQHHLGGAVPHATGTQLNDEVEANVLHDAAGAGVPWLSIKECIGHTGGASGVLGIIAALTMLTAGERVAAGVDRDWIDIAAPHLRGRARAAAPVMVSAYAFGGNNASVLLGGAS